MPAKKLDPLVGVNPPPVPPPNQGWGARIEAMFTRAFAASVGAWLGVFSNLIAWGFNKFFEHLEAELIEISSAYIDTYANHEAIPKEYKDLLNEAKSGNHAAALLVLAGASVGLFAGGLSKIFEAVWDKYAQLVYKAEHSTLFSLEQLTSLWFRVPQEQTIWREQILRYGIHENNIPPLIALAAKRLGAIDLVRLGRRFPQNVTDYDRELQAQGFLADNLSNVKLATLLYPQPDDLIRFAVRDVFRDDIVQKYGYDEDLPAQFEPEMRAASFAPDYAKYYWRAHWQLPSINDVIEMFHRTYKSNDPNKTDLDTVREYLRINDYPRFWRDRLIGITYTLPTRVDIRRFFDLGIWDRNKTKEYYFKLGYDEEGAEALTQLAEKASRPAEKDITQAAIIKAYKTGQYSRTQAIAGLLTVNLDENEANFYLDMADFEIQTALQNEELDRIETLYVNNILDSVQANEQLGPLNLPAEQLTRLFQLWDIRRKKNIKLPTQAELEEFYLNGIIQKDDYETTLKQLNFSPERILWTLQRADQKYELSATKKNADALAEQQRLTTDELATQYAKDRAGVDVQIAEANLQIADIKVALYGIDDPQQQADAAQQILALQHDIKQYQLDKANLKLNLTSAQTGEA